MEIHSGKRQNTLREISANLRTMRMAEHASLAIVVCDDIENIFPEDGRDYWVEDISAATENLLLAAHGIEKPCSRIHPNM